MCLLGLRKRGFEDMDDKIFDGERLYIIDVDECCDLYDFISPDYKAMLLNPTDTSALKKFRHLQRETFRGKLRDTIFAYKESLTPSSEDREAYVTSFFNKMGWRKPNAADIKDLTTFEEGYTTFDSWMGSMTEE